MSSKMAYDEFKNYPAWKDAASRARSFSKKKSSATILAAQEKRKKLLAQLSKINAIIIKDCPHPLKAITVEYWGNEDDYGSYRSGTNYALDCEQCGEELVSWSTDE